ncbi:glucuronate isomerase, partial [Sphaerochaeta sp. S2]|uniref:glucuronate isomerase n=1 Tax=Sphaerochaeta sp. S2 TaxID=2798868 RepID=UPI0018E9D100
GINIERETFIPWIRSLGKRMSCEITSFDELLSSMEKRLDFFHEMGCRLSDHALDVVEHQQTTKEEVEAIFFKGLNSEVLTSDDISKYKGYMIVFFGKAYHKRGWAMQLHIGAHRNNSTRMYKKLGPDTGYDSIHDEPFATSLIGILDSLDVTGELPKTIIYTLNPRDNEVIATVIGSFQGDGIKGKVQFGSGWWFNDQIDGMNRQMEALQQLGMLAHFVGMLTDSRSFLSFTRHDYFRRLLCERIGIAVEDGLYPNDLEFLGKMVENICYNNALNYFDIEV